MSKDFKELAARVQSTWSDDARAVHEAASTVFRAEMSAQEAFGRELADARKRAELTQPALAGLTGINQSEISRIENGNANPTLETVSRLAAALHLSLRLAPSGH